MKSYYTNKLIKISFLLLCLMAIIINIHAMDNDEDTVTVSRVKYDTIMNENEIMQNEIARLQNLLKSRKFLNFYKQFSNILEMSRHF